MTLTQRWPGPLRRIWELLFYVAMGLKLQRDRGLKYDAVMCYGWNKTGIAAVLLKWLTGAKLIIEIPGTPGAAQLYESPSISWRKRLKSRVNVRLLRFVLNQADAVKLLSPEQIDEVGFSRKLPTAVYHDLVAVSLLEPSGVDEKYLLLIGHPWYLKGVDILIKAFKKVESEFPEHRLRIIGHCPDRTLFEELRDGSERIEFLPGVKHDEAIRQISQCSAFVLPSRTEAMGRVLLEAMALGKPIVASRVDGIPHYIRHNETGLLFESEDVDQLAECLRQVLGDAALATRLVENGLRVVHERYSERCFAEEFDRLVRSVLHQSPADETAIATNVSNKCPAGSSRLS